MLWIMRKAASFPLQRQNLHFCKKQRRLSTHAYIFIKQARVLEYLARFRKKVFTTDLNQLRSQRIASMFD